MAVEIVECQDGLFDIIHNAEVIQRAMLLKEAVEWVQARDYRAVVLIEGTIRLTL